MGNLVRFVGALIFVVAVVGTPVAYLLRGRYPAAYPKWRNALVGGFVAMVAGGFMNNNKAGQASSGPTQAPAVVAPVATPKAPSPTRAEPKVLTPAQAKAKAEAERKARIQAQYDAAQVAAKRKEAEREARIQAQYEAAQRAERERREARQREATRLAAEPTPSEVELVVLRSDDNYGIEPYFILKTAFDEEVAVTGKARLVLTVKDYGDDTERTVYDQTFTVDARYDYSEGTRGLGAFQRDALFFRIPKIGTENLSNESGNAYLTFTSSQGTVVKAKDYVFYP